jgi:hypothetical protein
VARFYYFPGRYQQATFFDLDIDLERWTQLSRQQQTRARACLRLLDPGTVARGEAGQWQVLRELQAGGVQLKRWPAAILVAFEDCWRQVAAQARRATQTSAEPGSPMRAFGPATIGVSIGIALAPPDATEPDALLKDAGMALYRTKAEGRGCYRLFEPEIGCPAPARRELIGVGRVRPGKRMRAFQALDASPATP